MSEKYFYYHSNYNYYNEFDFERIRSVLLNFQNEEIEPELVDIIELNSICNFIKNFGKETTELTEFELDNLPRNLKKRIGIFISNRKLEDFSNDYFNLPGIYKDNFWTLLLQYDVLKKVSVDEFRSFINQHNMNIRTVLRHKTIGKYFDSVIKGSLLKDARNFEVFVDKFESKPENSSVAYNFDFTDVELNDWARRYCMLPDANLSYLEAISKWGKHNLKELDPSIILLAQHKYREGLEKVFPDKKGASILSMGISFDSGLEKDFEFTESSNHSEYLIKFNRDWLNSEQDGRTILKNFVYFFGFFNSVGQFSIPASPYSLTDLITRTSVFNYANSSIFKYTKTWSDLIFLAYFDYLTKEGIDLESIFEEFYNSFIENDYFVQGFFFNPSNSDNNFYDRCKLIIPEMDSILRQFTLFSKNKNIDMELFEISSGDVDYNEIPSLSKKKFVYFSSQEQIETSHLLFSTNSIMVFPNSKNSSSTFFELILSGVTRNDFNQFQMSKIDELISRNILNVGVNQTLYFTNLNEIHLYRLIWQKGYISTMNLSEDQSQIIQVGVDSGKLKYEGTLFSSEDMKYISYLLDDKKYNDSLKIRNKITHGSYSKKKDKEYKNFYLNLLGIVLLYTFRIDEELDWYSRTHKKSEKRESNTHE